MNYQRLQQEIKTQAQWADELSRQPSRNDKEPSDSQRRLLQLDDEEATP
jgi:hypothetical protein